MRIRQAHVVVLVAGATAIVLPLAALRTEPTARGQTVPPGGGPVTTPQPTVPCTPVEACGRGAPQVVDFVWAYIQRYCDGSAVPTPPGQTTFALIYGNGTLATADATFSGTLQANGIEIPSEPLLTLIPGERDVRIRQGVVNDGDIFTVTLQAVDPAGAPLAFGDGSTTKVLSASGSCPTTTAIIPPGPIPNPVVPPAFPTLPDIPTVTIERGGNFPPSL